MERDGSQADLEEKLANYRKALEHCGSDERWLYEELVRQLEEKLQSDDSDKKRRK